MTLLSPNHNYAADEIMAKIPQHHIPTTEEKVRASQSFDKSVLVAAHMAALHDAYIFEMVTHPVTEVTIKPSSPTSSIGGLKPSTLKQLKVGKVHRRRVLRGTLCVETLCTKNQNGNMVVNVFEDEEGNATPIYLSNAMEGNGGSAQAQQFYPQGSKVAVKEPYLTRLPDGEIVLLVDKITDLVFLWVPDRAEESTEVSPSKEEEESTEVSPSKEEGKEGEVGAAATPASNVGSRELSLDDLLATRNGEGGSGDSEKPEGVTKGNASENALLAHEAEAREVEKEEIKEGLLNDDGLEESELIQGEVESSPGNATDAGSASEVQTGEIKKEEEGLSNDRGAEELELIQGDVESSPGNFINGGGNEAEKAPEVQVTEIKKEGVKEEAPNEGGRKESELFQEDAIVSPEIGRETAAMLRVKGNALFARGDFNNAVSVYLRGAEVARADGSKMEEVLCLSNRAEVLLRLCRNQAALDDADAALKLLRACADFDAGDLALAKALFRKGRALMGLHKYEDGMRVLQEVLAKAPADRMLREAALKCRRHLEHVLKPGKRQRAAANRKKSAASAKQ